MTFEGLLPVGSVVLLKEGNHRVMILGYCQKIANDDHVYDYVGCLWPEGYLRPDENYVFNGDTIENVYFLGYQTDGQQVFAARIEETLKKYRAENEGKE